MSSTYSPDLRIELIGTGDQAGVWGATTNNNLAYVIEQSVAGYVSVAVASANQAFTHINGGTAVAADNQAVHASLALTTSTGANFAVYAPPASKQYTIYNASLYTATIYNSTVIGNTTAAGTGVAIPAGKTMTVWSDGTNFAQQNTHLISPTLASPTMTAPVLGTPASGTMTNVTGLPLTTAVIGTLPVLNGGTGVTTSTGSGSNVLSTSPTLVTPALGTPSSATLTNATGLPISTGVSGLGTGVATFLATPSSANLASAVTDETGSGSLVFSASPTFTGTPAAPTASAGTSTTQIATTAFVQAALQALYPVGSIYSSTVSTNPGTLFGFGTWVAYAAGRVLIGQNGTSFVAGTTGGSADATLVSHTHTATSTFTGTALGTHTHTGTTATGGTHTHTYKTYGLGNTGQIGNANTNYDWGFVQTGNPTGTAEGAHNHTFTTDGTSGGTPAGTVATSNTTEGSSATNANLQPYVVVYMWNRTA